MPDSAASFEELIYEVSDHVATITLNAPDRMNTISGPMLDGLSEALLKADADPDVRCVILTGAGRAFCAGLNLESATKGEGIGSGAVSSAHLDLRNTPPTILFNMDTPTICAINGGRPAMAWTPPLAATSASCPKRPRWPLLSQSAASCPKAAAPGSCRACWAGRRPRS